MYGHELDRLFGQILGIRNATAAEALECLKQLKIDSSTTMIDVTEVYIFIQEHCATT